MNYPFDPHNSSSQNSKNQFIISQSSMINSAFIGDNSNGTKPNEVQKIFSYMKNVMSNPMLMDQMQKFLALKQSQKNSSFILKQNQSLSISRMETQLRQPPVSYINEPNYQNKPQPLRANPNPNVKKVKTPQIAPQISNRKKSTDGLMAYLSNDNIEQSQVVENTTYFSQKNYNDQRPIKPLPVQQKFIKPQQRPLPQPKQAMSFDDMPIRSQYIANSQFSNFNSKPAYLQNQFQLRENKNIKIPIKTSTSTKNNSNQNLKTQLELDERPITGTRKDFKELLKEKFSETPFDEKPIPTLSNNSQKNWTENDEHANSHQHQDQSQQQHKPKKQFLKRGSRQYLSSAKDKKSVQKKPHLQTKIKDSQQNLNSSRLGLNNNQRQKTPTKRDLSQNRVLSKRSTINDRSVTKIKTQNQLNNSSCFEKEEDQTVKTVAAKNQRIFHNSKSTTLPPKSKVNNLTKTTTPNGINAGSGKKKNVFDDSSSQDVEGQNQSDQNQNDQQYSTKRSEIVQKQKKYQSYQPEKEFNMLSREKKEEIIEGVYLTRSQLNTILQRYAPTKTQPVAKNINSNQQKFNQLRKKYTDLCNLLEKQKIQHQELMEKDKQQFENFKQQEILKIKNQRRVMERQIKSTMPSQIQNLQKDKEQVQNLKKQLEKERQEHKKKQKNNKILIEKYKKENQDLKIKLEKLQEEFERQSQTSAQNNFSATHSEKNFAQNNPRTCTSNQDKSKSKIATKDLSPGKAKMIKPSKALEQNDEENDQDKNYKKTVPLYKQNQDKKVTSPSFNQNNKKGSDKGAKFTNDDQNSDDDNLPTFKVDNKKVDDPKGAKPQKKYQFIDNSVEQSQNKKQLSKKSISNHKKTGSKNVFADDSDSDHNHEVQQDNGNSEEEGGQQGGFFKTEQKYEELSELMSSKFSIKDVSEEMIERLFRFENNCEYRKYLQRVNNPKRMIVNSSKNGVDKKMTNIYNDKSKEILFENGVKKEIFQDGYTIIYFKNGDIKQKLEDGTTLYYFSDKKVDQITLVNGLNIYRFDNNQVEIHYDGNKYIEIRNPDGTIKMLGSPIH